jgi:ADP-ribose pyrophosphatase
VSDLGDAAHERTLSSRRGFDGHLLQIRVDEVELPSGRRSQREVVEHPGSVAIVALTERDELILVRQWRHAVGHALLEIPAGTSEPGERAAETATRELREETGFAATELREIAALYPTAGYSNEEMRYFLATGCREVEHGRDADEGTEVVLVPRAEIGSMLRPGDRQVRDAKTMIGVLWLMAGVE